jgi:hypothetical protein
VGMAGALACGPPQPATPTPTPIPTSTSPDFKRLGAPITTPCVLHGGHAGGSGSEAGLEHASCRFDAECIAARGHAARGDGFVGVSCVDLSCACTWSYVDGGKDQRAAFTLDALTDQNGACKNLLVERCMAGMSLYRADAGAP